jgi:predicted esterase
MQSVEFLGAFIQSEMDSGIPEERIVLGGFSQGGAISLITGLGGSQWRNASDTKDGWKLGGVICLSGWLPVREKLVRQHLKRNKETFLSHVCSICPHTHLQYPCSGVTECRMKS